MSGSAILTFRPFAPIGPTFTFRPARPREDRFLQYEALAEGLRFHDTRVIRDEALLALRSLWPPREYSAGAAKLRRMWMRLDSGQALSPDNAGALADLNQRLAEAHAPLNNMAADNALFLRAAPLIAASMMLDGWTAISVPFCRIAGRVPAATLKELERALAEMARTVAPSQPEGQAFLDLTMAALIHATGAAGNMNPNPNPHHPVSKFTQKRRKK